MPAVYGIDSSTDARAGELAGMVETLRQHADPLLLPGAYVLEVFPFLRHLPRWVPGMGIRRTVEEGRRAMRRTPDKLDVMSTAANVSAPCFRILFEMLTRNVAGASCAVPC